MPGAKITYLLGAGASANKIPVVEKFNEGLLNFLGEVNAAPIPTPGFSGFDKEIRITREELKSKFLKEAQEILTEVRSHASIDTFARKLYLTKRNLDLRRLKALVAIFLIYRQLTEGYDIRYDVFLATILDVLQNGKIVLPKNLQIVTWNYDFQFEMAVSNFLRKYSLSATQDFLNVHPNHLRDFKKEPLDKSSLIRLNGSSIGYYFQGEFRATEFELTLRNKSVQHEMVPFIGNLLTNYYWFTLTNADRPYLEYGSTASIKYAWENDSHVKDLRQYAIQKIEGTESLVIIGYSFPTFNREMDKLLLDSMPNLQKVYIQAKEDSIYGINERFESLMEEWRINNIGHPQLIIVQKDTEEFFIPFEFSRV